MPFEVARVIPADHSSLAGHFPGSPVVPGVVILDEIISALEEWRRPVRWRILRLVKFLSPLFPDEHFTIRLQEMPNHIVSFSCHVADRLIADGRFEVT